MAAAGSDTEVRRAREQQYAVSTVESDAIFAELCVDFADGDIDAKLDETYWHMPDGMIYIMHAYATHIASGRWRGMLDVKHLVDSREPSGGLAGTIVRPSSMTGRTNYHARHRHADLVKMHPFFDGCKADDAVKMMATVDVAIGPRQIKLTCGSVPAVKDERASAPAVKDGRVSAPAIKDGRASAPAKPTPSDTHQCPPFIITIPHVQPRPIQTPTAKPATPSWCCNM